MPRQVLQSVENNFIGGLKTEFTGLNFPENSVTETDNCVFDRLGRITRRKGIDLEDEGVYSSVDRAGHAVNSYVWLNAAGDGHTNLLVVQVGNTIYFYESSDNSTALSQQLLVSTIDLVTFTTVGDASTEECQFGQGNGYLFVFSPNINSLYVEYDPVTQIVTPHVIDIRIRDFEGINDSLNNTTNPITLSKEHRYNLANQGWKSAWEMNTVTSVAISTGTKIVTVDRDAVDMPVFAGMRVTIYSASDHANNVVGYITSFIGNTLTLEVTAATGAGPFTDGVVVEYLDVISIYKDGLGFYPNNSEVWWRYKDASNVFSPVVTFGTITPDNYPSPKGRYIVSAFNIKRSLLSGIADIPDVSTDGQRASTGAFYASRVWYSGLKTTKLHSTIYFSQIIERPEQFGDCFQQNDPTSEDFFNLLPSDGGVISIQGAGQIIKLFSTKSALIVFASNGIWAVSGSGSDGLGFTADAYTIVKLSTVKTLSATSFVEANDNISWWTVEGIYNLALGDVGGSQGAKIQSLTNNTIATYYKDIPNDSKLAARGAYNPISFIVQWIYSSTNPINLTEKYEYDKVLCLNTLTGAFYTWTISNSPITINGLVSVESAGGTLLKLNVVDEDGNQVVDGSGNDVVTFTIGGNVIPVFKYIISKTNGLTYDMSFAEEYKPSFADWESEDEVGKTYGSNFITGFAVHSDAQKFFSLQYINVYSDADEETGDTGFSIQGLWDFASSGNSGKWSSVQRTNIMSDNFDVVRRRFRIRGKGMALQLKFASFNNVPFSIIGWGKWETKNSTP